MIVNKKCPMCYEGVLRSWDELSEDEREVVNRLASSAEYPIAEREAMHRWCPRCWYESSRNESQI